MLNNIMKVYIQSSIDNETQMKEGLSTPQSASVLNIVLRRI